VQHAHQKGIIHRDLKPSNILVTLHDGVPVPKVIDFGIAKATEGRLTDHTLFTAFEQFIGTPAYMSPEQAEMSGLDIDTRSDIYSLGVLLYELLTGRTPIDTKELVAAGLDELRRTIREQDPVRPSTRLRTLVAEEQTTAAKRRGEDLPKLIHLLRGDLDWIVMRCLEKDRTRRYETANGLAMDIQRQLNNQPVLARPPSMAYRLEKSFRRNRVLFTAAALVALALVCGAVVSFWQAVRATDAGRREAEQRKKADQSAALAHQNAALAKKESDRARASEIAARQSLYAADMSLAYRAWHEGNIGAALESLNKHIPAASQPDFRGWEWRYLWGACQSDELYTFTNLTAGVFEVAVSPDGNILATAETYYGAAGAIYLWEMVSRKRLAAVELTDAIGSIAFSPDGNLLAYGTLHHGIKLYNLAQKAAVPLFPGGSRDWNGAGLAFSPDGHMLAAHQKDGVIMLWDLGKQMPIRTLAAPAESPSVTFLPDSKTLVTAHADDGTICLWSVATGQQLHCFTNHTADVSSVAISPDGHTLASASWDHTVRIWDLNDRRQVRVLTNHTSFVRSLVFSQDGKILASGSADSTIKLWDTTTWNEADTLRGNFQEVWSLALAPDGKLFSGAKDGAVKVWNIRPKPRAQLSLSSPTGSIGWGFRQFPDSGITIAWHTNDTFTLWRCGSLRPVGVFRKPDLQTLTNSVAVTFSPKGDRAAWVKDNGDIVVWDIPGERQVATAPWLSERDIPEARWRCFAHDYAFVAATSPDGKRVCFAAPNRLTVRELETLKELASLARSGEPPEDSMCFGTDNASIALASMTCSIEAWNLDRKEYLGPWRAHSESIEAMAFMPDGRGLVSASHDTTVKLWDLRSQKEVRRFGRTQNAWTAVAVSPDGTRVAGGEILQSIKIWDAATGQEVGLLKPAQAGPLRYLAFLPDGNTLVSAHDNQVHLWRAPSWQEIQAIQEKKSRVQ
jgi:WD40 repeat protein